MDSAFSHVGLSNASRPHRSQKPNAAQSSAQATLMMLLAEIQDCANGSPLRDGVSLTVIQRDGEGALSQESDTAEPVVVEGANGAESRRVHFFSSSTGPSKKNILIVQTKDLAEMIVQIKGLAEQPI